MGHVHVLIFDLWDTSSFGGGSVGSTMMTWHVGVWNPVTFAGRSVFDGIQSDCPVDHEAVMKWGNVRKFTTDTMTNSTKVNTPKFLCRLCTLYVDKTVVIHVQ